MTPERFRQIDAEFQAALDLTPRERGAYLDQSCGDDPELRAEVESLLATTGENTDFIGSAVYQAASAVTSHHDRIGPYRVTGVVGQGGMGIVYLAVRDDDHYQKQVAIRLESRDCGGAR